MPYRTWITMTFPTHVIFRYHQPLRRGNINMWAFLRLFIQQVQRTIKHSTYNINYNYIKIEQFWLANGRAIAPRQFSSTGFPSVQSERAARSVFAGSPLVGVVFCYLPKLSMVSWDWPVPGAGRAAQPRWSVTSRAFTGRPRARMRLKNDINFFRK